MLTKDLLNFRRRGDYIKPVFIDSEDPKLLTLARSLLSIYEIPEGKTVGMTAKELTELSEPVVKSQRNLKLAKGLHKLILDRCKFSSPPDRDFPALREELFSRAADLLRDGSFELQLDKYRDASASSTELNAERDDCSLNSISMTHPT